MIKMEQRKFIDALRHTRFNLGHRTAGVNRTGLFPFSIMAVTMMQTVDLRLISRAIREALDAAHLR